MKFSTLFYALILALAPLVAIPACNSEKVANVVTEELYNIANNKFIKMGASVDLKALADWTWSNKYNALGVVAFVSGCAVAYKIKTLADTYASQAVSFCKRHWGKISTAAFIPAAGILLLKKYVEEAKK